MAWGITQEYPTTAGSNPASPTNRKKKSMPNRDPLLQAINNYASAIKAGTETLGSHPAYSALCVELDRYEFAVIDETKIQFSINQNQGGAPLFK
jgi:hypothetical protein